MNDAAQKSTSDLQTTDAPRRAALIAAARRAFVRNGVEGTSLDDVIAEAGGSRRNIYRLFGGKDGLVEAVVETILDDTAKIAEAPPNRGLPPRDWLIAVGEAFTHRMLDPNIVAVLRHFIASGGATPQAAERLWQMGPARFQRALGKWLEIQHNEGRLYVPDIDAAATLLPTMFRANFQIEMLMGRKSVITEEEIQSNVERTVDFFLSATSVR